MNWIIRNTKKLKHHTNLNVLLQPIRNDILNFKWLISDLEINTSEMERLPINHQKDWFLISSKEMEIVQNSDTQIVWGVFSAFDKDLDIKIDIENLPYSEGNSKIWKNGNLQLENSQIEIIAWDSGCTIVKFTDQELSNKFSAFFIEAVELESYIWK